jgi:aldehyde:ferredoxin oxidoreductase
MLKYAGWDGVVIEGKADRPVWIDIRNRDVMIRDCNQLSLWGKDTWDCQKTIWEYVAGSGVYGDWVTLHKNGLKTTQRPAVLAIGPAGENLSRVACLVHDASNASGQGGFGAVWGSKNLKAISVIGTGSIKINDPKALMKTRIWQKENYAFDLNALKENFYRTQDYRTEFHGAPRPGVLWGKSRMGEGRPRSGQRPQACVGCHSGCRARYESGFGNEASCITTGFYNRAKTHEIQYKASDLLNRYGINAYEVYKGIDYIRTLHKMGVLGKNKEIHCDLDFDDFGSFEFVDQFLRMLAYRENDFGNDIAEGFMRAAQRWGRLEGNDGDLKTGLLQFSYWGLPEHSYDPRAQLEWGYGSILGDRDANEHDFNKLFKDPTISSWFGKPPQATAEEAVTIYTDKMVPYQGDLLMLDYSTENMYSEHIAKLVSWHRYYTRFWKQSVLYCDWRWPDFLNIYAPGKIGSTGEAEQQYFNAVTGKRFRFLDGIELGRKIWNLDNAIWTLQGRHRDMVHFADYIYRIPFQGWGGNYRLPGRKNGKWTYINACGRYIDREKFEAFKTKFYKLEGWDPSTGWPMRRTLESLGLGYVADELGRKGKAPSSPA